MPVVPGHCPSGGFKPSDPFLPMLVKLGKKSPPLIPNTTYLALPIRCRASATELWQDNAWDPWE